MSQFIGLYHPCYIYYHDEFNSFIKALEFNLDKTTTFNLYSVVVLGSFNAKPCNWCINGKTNFKGVKIDKLTSKISFLAQSSQILVMVLF